MIQIENDITRMLGVRFPLVMAPMFLVSNEAMIKEAIEAGMLGCFPSLNFKKEGQLESVLSSLNDLLDKRKGQPGTYGVNLIVQPTNSFFEKHLQICVEHKVPVFISSLGNPERVIKAAHSYGAKVFCDVTNIKHAKKCASLNADGFVAVGQGAGGHAGPYPLMLLLASLKKHFPAMPVLAAGGIAHGSSILSVLAAGASAAYVGTRFIASNEATVSDEYKNAVLSSGMEDIVLTERLSGIPCTIVNTPYAKKIGYKQSGIERFLARNPRTRKAVMSFIQQRGYRWLETAIKPGSHKTLWCAGQSAEMIEEIKPVRTIIEDLIGEFEDSYKILSKTVVVK